MKGGSRNGRYGYLKHYFNYCLRRAHWGNQEPCIWLYDFDTSKIIPRSNFLLSTKTKLPRNVKHVPGRVKIRKGAKVHNSSLSWTKHSFKFNLTFWRTVSSICFDPIKIMCKHMYVWIMWKKRYILVLIMLFYFVVASF